MPRDEGPAILDTAVALEAALGEIAEERCGPDGGGHKEGEKKADVAERPPEAKDEPGKKGRTQPSERPFPGFARAHPGGQGVAAPEGADEVGRRVGRPDQDEKAQKGLASAGVFLEKGPGRPPESRESREPRGQLEPRSGADGAAVKEEKTENTHGEESCGTHSQTPSTGLEARPGEDEDSREEGDRNPLAPPGETAETRPLTGGRKDGKEEEARPKLGWGQEHQDQDQRNEDEGAQKSRTHGPQTSTGAAVTRP